MNIRFLIIVYLIFLSFFIGCKDFENKTNNNLKGNKLEDKMKDEFEGTAMVTNEEELMKALKESYSVTLEKNIESKNNLVIEGDFLKTDTNEHNKVSHIGRRLNIFYIDSNNTINNYTLSVPKLVVKSSDTTIKGGKINGDIYVENEGFILDDTKVEGNIYFKNDKLKNSFKLEDTANVSGKIAVQ